MAIFSKNSHFKPENFKPMQVLDVEISQPLPDISALDENRQKIFHRALVLLRLHSYPIGLLPVNFETDEITSDQLAEQLWNKFGNEINQHLQQDELQLQDHLSPAGLTTTAQVKCLAERQEFLTHAPLVSIIISTRERVQSLANVLNSLLMLEYPKFEVILVDNAPTSKDTFEYFNFIQPVFIRNNINLRYVREDMPGLAVAHNRGLELVRGSIVAFTDDDVVVDKYWLVELVRGFNAAPNVGCVTGLVVPVELQTPAQVLFEEFGGFVKGLSKRVYDLGTNRPADSLFPYTAGRFGTGANMAFRTDILRKVGGFDPALGIGTPAMGADDMAAFFETIMRGFQLVYTPTALILHQHRRTYESLQKQMFGYGAGLTAFIFKCMIDNPHLVPDIISKIPKGIIYAFSHSSPKNLHKSIYYPHELERIERKGMFYGPYAYLRSRLRYRKFRKEFSEEELNIDPLLPHHYVITGWVEDQQGEKSTKEL